MSLFITYVSCTCFRPHRSIFRSVLQAVFADWYVVILCVLLDTSSRYEVVGSADWYMVIRVLLDTSSHYFVTAANTACKTLLMMDRRGPKHVELTYIMNKTHSLKNLVYLVGLHIYCSCTASSIKNFKRPKQTTDTDPTAIATYISEIANYINIM